MLRLIRREDAAAPAESGVIAQQAIFAARAEISRLTTAASIDAYIVALVAATRRPGDYGDKLGRWIAIGASPRGSLALDRCSRVQAWLRGRGYVLPEDVQAVAHDCLRHRLSLNYDARAEGVSADEVIDELIRQVAVAA
jgi:MoxR-like ATPase